MSGRAKANYSSSYFLCCLVYSVTSCLTYTKNTENTRQQENFTFLFRRMKIRDIFKPWNSSCCVVLPPKMRSKRLVGGHFFWKYILCVNTCQMHIAYGYSLLVLVQPCYCCFATRLDRCPMDEQRVSWYFGIGLMVAQPSVLQFCFTKGTQRKRNTF